MKTAPARRLDVLVNNAGLINRKIIRAMTPAEWRRVIGVNPTGAFLGIRAAVPAMRQGDSTVNIAPAHPHKAFGVFLAVTSAKTIRDLP